MATTPNHLIRPPPTTSNFLTSFIHLRLPTDTLRRTFKCKTISAALSSPPNNPPQQNLYQPFRPPPSPLPAKYQSLDTNGRLEIIANRLGLWFDYAPLITALIHEGFTPSTIEEVTGLTSVDQNRYVVATQVRDSLIHSKLDEQTLAFFDNGGAELLYEIRLLSAAQRAASARFLVEMKFDAKGAQDLARAIKDFPRRRGDKGWESFDYALPGDCLAFLYFRQSREHSNPSDQRTNFLKRALEVAATEKAKNTILFEMDPESSKAEEVDPLSEAVKVPVVRLKFGEVAEASTVVLLPVCRAEENDVLEAPWKRRSEGEFGVVAAEKGWSRWVTLPGWGPVLGLGEGGVVVAYSDARALPWKANRSYREEAILVVADRDKRQVAADDGLYLVPGENGGGLRVVRGVVLKELGVKESLGVVVLVVRPPRDDNDEIADEEWD
uniref:Rubisco accumulation factor 1.1, chloroplastic n=1 Tax=Kalanchoe fedtschenkoi TaxID=63787 RepID=A0A7N0U1Q5_KALFE